MPPPFTFLKNFHNHDGKPPVIPPAPAEAKTHTIRRKLTKSAKGQTHHQVPHVPTTARAEDLRTFHQRHENRAVSPTQSESSPTRSHHGTTENRVLEMHHHTSSLASHLTHHNQHEVDQQAISVIPPSPVAAQYMSSVHRYPQVPAAIPIIPSRSWSPIPSVHRESIPDDSELDRSGLYGSEGRSWVNHVHHAVPELDFYNDAGEISTLRKESNIAAQDRTYIDYSMGRISKPESQKSFSNLKQQDENVVRRQPFQWNDRPPETIEPAIREHEISSDGDSEPEIYHYIVPAGLNVVFQDEEGNEITRVGKRGRQGQGSHTGRSAPIVVHDEFGKELYRDPLPKATSTRDPTYKHGRLRNGPYISRKETKENTVLPDSGEIHPQPWLSSPASRTSSRSTKTILIDERGNQIPIKSPSVRQDTHRRLQHSPFRNVSHHGEIEHM